MIDIKIRLTKEEAEQKLKDMGFIRLPAGSYFTWIEKDRFEMYKSYLSFKNGAWIPRSDKLVELAKLEEGYKQADLKKLGSELYSREEINSLAKQEELS